MNIFIHIHNSNVKYYLKASQFQIRSNLKKKKKQKRNKLSTPLQFYSFEQIVSPSSGPINHKINFAERDSFDPFGETSVTTYPSSTEQQKRGYTGRNKNGNVARNKYRTATIPSQGIVELIRH